MVDTLTAAPEARTRGGAATLAVLLAGVFISTLDFFIVNVAIPDTQRDLGASPSAVQFIVAGYGLALSALLITGGRLGDIHGRRRLFLVGTALFTAASAACGAAPSTGALIAGRFVQGGAVALLTPQVLAIVNTVYTGERRARAFGAYGLTLGLGAVFGQLIGGVLIQLDVAGLGWRSVFLINVPVGVAIVAAGPRLIPESRGAGRRLDLVGTVLVSLGLVAIVLPLVEGRQDGWPFWTWPALAAAAVLIALFAAYQHRLKRRGGEPLVDLALFRERSFTVGVVLSMAFQLTMASYFLIFALYLQFGRGLSALQSGLLFLALGAGYFAAAGRSPALAGRYGRNVLLAGAGLVALGYGGLAGTVAALGTGGGILWTIPALVVAGAGMGLFLPPQAAIVLSRVGPEHAAAASGVQATMLQAGNAIGVALIGIVFYRVLGTPVPGHFPGAFAAGLVALVAMSAVAAGLVRLLPAPERH